jgi:hypothetical protein
MRVTIYTVSRRYVMVKKISFLIIVSVLLLGFSSPLFAGGIKATVTKVKYTLNGAERIVALSTAVSIEFTEEKTLAPTKIFTFPHPIEGTITSVDLYLEELEGDFTGWMIGDGFISGSSFPSEGVNVTGTTDTIYVAL